MANIENSKSQRDAAYLWADRRYTAVMSGSKNSEGEACGARHDVKNPRLNTSSRDNPER